MNVYDRRSTFRVTRRKSARGGRKQDKIIKQKGWAQQVWKGFPVALSPVQVLAPEMSTNEKELHQVRECARTFQPIRRRKFALIFDISGECKQAVYLEKVQMCLCGTGRKVAVVGSVFWVCGRIALKRGLRGPLASWTL